jgi:hypothetical protein
MVCCLRAALLTRLLLVKSTVKVSKYAFVIICPVVHILLVIFKVATLPALTVTPLFAAVSTKAGIVGGDTIDIRLDVDNGAVAQIRGKSQFIFSRSTNLVEDYLLLGVTSTDGITLLIAARAEYTRPTDCSAWATGRLP